MQNVRLTTLSGESLAKRCCLCLLILLASGLVIPGCSNDSAEDSSTDSGKTPSPRDPVVKKHLDAGELAHKAGDFDVAQGEYQAAVGRAEQLHDDLALAGALDRLGDVYLSQGKLSEAQSLYERSLALRQEQLGSEHEDTVDSIARLAATHLCTENYEEVEALCREVFRVKEKALGKEHPETLESLEALVHVLLIRRKATEAGGLLEELLERTEVPPGGPSERVVELLVALAAVHLASFDTDKALETLTRTFELLEDAFTPDRALEIVSILIPMQICTALGGEDADSEEHYGRALRLLREAGDVQDADFAKALTVLATMGCDTVEESDSLYERALSILENVKGAESVEVADVLLPFATHYWATKRPVMAESCFTRALRITEQHYGKDHELLVPVLREYASFLERSGREQEATTMTTRVAKIEEAARVPASQPQEDDQQ